MRRSFGWTVVLGAACVAAQWSPHSPYGVFLLPVAVVAAAVAGRWLRPLLTAVITIAAVDLAGLAVLAIGWPDLLLSRGISGQLAVLLAAALPWWLGRLRQSAVGRIHRERQLIDERARASERALIAADMHDAVGHDLALIALQAGALELSEERRTADGAAVEGSAHSAQQAAAAIRRQATAATDRLHVIVGLLREGTDASGSVGESSGPTDLAALIDDARVAGISFETVELGRRQDSWSTPTLHAAYRVLQESLTNIAKHAPGSDVSVTVDDSEDPIRIEVINSRPAHRTAERDPAGSGSGLIALDERLRLLGGRLMAEPQRTGFVVRATIPEQAGRGASTDSSAVASKLRREQRRSLRRAAALPVALALLIGAVLAATYVATFVRTGLSPDHFAQIEVGDQRRDIQSLLPSHAQSGPTPTLVVPPAPEGTRCDFYLDRSAVLSLRSDMFRLCFDQSDGSGTEVVVSKDILLERRS